MGGSGGRSSSGWSDDVLGSVGVGDDNSGSLGLDGLTSLGLDDLNLVSYLDVWLDGDDDLSSLLLNNSLSAGVGMGVGGGLWNADDFLSNMGASVGAHNWLGVENLDGFLNSVAGALGSNIVNLGKVDSQVLVSEFDFSLGLDTELLAGSWLAVNNNGLGGDVGFNVRSWNDFGIV